MGGGGRLHRTKGIDSESKNVAFVFFVVFVRNRKLSPSFVFFFFFFSFLRLAKEGDQKNRAPPPERTLVVLADGWEFLSRSRAPLPLNQQVEQLKNVVQSLSHSSASAETNRLGEGSGKSGMVIRRELTPFSLDCYGGGHSK